jgi:hypothetical protein
MYYPLRGKYRSLDAFDATLLQADVITGYMCIFDWYAEVKFNIRTSLVV